MGQIIKSLLSFCLSVCKHSYGRNFNSILMKFCRLIRGPKSYWKNRVCLGNLPLIFGIGQFNGVIWIYPLTTPVAIATIQKLQNFALQSYIYPALHDAFAGLNLLPFLPIYRARQSLCNLIKKNQTHKLAVRAHDFLSRIKSTTDRRTYNIRTRQRKKNNNAAERKITGQTLVRYGHIKRKLQSSSSSSTSK